MEETSMLNSKVQRVDQFIDSQPMSDYQKRVIFFCFLVAGLDGFDAACVGFVGPAIRQHWHVTAAALSPLFGLGLLGTMAGGILLGPVADRYGRKTVLIASVVVFGFGSLASAFASDIQYLAALRFLTGIGLGGAMPNSITLTSEYCPERKRSSYVTLMFCGFTIGASAGGLLTAAIVDTVGWQGVFLVGGILPMLLVPFLMVLMPESIRYLLLFGSSAASVRAECIASRIVAPGNVVPRLLADEKIQHSPVRELFSREVALGTLLIWAIFFCSLLIIYLLTSWMPMLLSSAGISLKSAALISMMHQVGAALGSIWLGRQMDRYDSQRVLAWSYLTAVPMLVVCAFAGESKSLIVLAVFALGFLVSGGNIGAYALASGYYPTGNRATGVSWANAVGRIGAALGSVAGGLMMAAGLGIRGIILVLVIPALVATVSLFALGRFRGRLGGGRSGNSTQQAVAADNT
jgi:AAHS family 4-hydroxybenzoate transporter-like MFS transporter